jgi:hypothetical protein
MAFRPRWTEEADSKFRELQEAATASLLNRQKNRKAKAARAEGLFKQIEKCVRLLLDTQDTRASIHTNTTRSNIRTIRNLKFSKRTCKTRRQVPTGSSGATGHKKVRSPLSP